MNPENILLIKSHSMGIGDLLRSSAAWDALKARWPSAKLHLLMLSKHAGYPSEAFIRSHYQLDSAHFVTVKAGDPGQPRQVSLPWREVLGSVELTLKDVPVDLVIDFESGGIRTSRLARSIARKKGAQSVGIAQFPLRSLFYDLSSPSTRAYRAKHGLSESMDYTERDFVVLEALGMQRNGRRIVLGLTDRGRAWQTAHTVRVEGLKTVILNIGCGTSDALVKRPDLGALADAMVAFYALTPFQLHLSGAAFESAVNGEFAPVLAEKMRSSGFEVPVHDWSGQLTLEELAALLQQADLVVSSDSGPYHMAVALGVPTLCWFNFDTPPSYHLHADVACLVQPQPSAFAAAAHQLLSADTSATQP
jgi:hypothetical protein